MKELQGKKLLVLGGVGKVSEIVEMAKKMGVYTIVADYYENSPVKKLADEAWLCSTADIPALAQRCKERGVDGVLSGFDDFNVKMAARLSEVIGTPFYATSDQMDQMMDKLRFKQTCRDHQVPGVVQYDWAGDFSQQALAALKFPVIIKPVDSSGGRGISVCHDAQELETAYDKALSYSKSKQIILERFMVGDEVGINYLLQDGRYCVTEMHDRYMVSAGEGLMPMPVAYVYPSKYLAPYLEKEDAQVQRMFREVGLTNGVLFLQGCVEDDTCYFYETGYRVAGPRHYHLTEHFDGFNGLSMLIRQVLTGKMADFEVAKLAHPALDKAVCHLQISIRPGKVAAVEGIDEIRAMPQIIDCSTYLAPGDVMEPTSVGTQKQIVTRLTIVGEDKADLARLIRLVYATYRVLDAAGDNMVAPGFDPARLFD